VDGCDAAREESGGTSNDVVGGAAEDRPGIELMGPVSVEEGIISLVSTLILGDDEGPFMLDIALKKGRKARLLLVLRGNGLSTTAF